MTNRWTLCVGTIVGISDSVGLSPDAALLVRPDDFVAWRTNALPESPENALGQALSRILGR
jgi:putative polyketide hydroxylase